MGGAIALKRCAATPSSPLNQSAYCTPALHTAPPPPCHNTPAHSHLALPPVPPSTHRRGEVQPWELLDPPSGFDTQGPVLAHGFSQVTPTVLQVCVCAWEEGASRGAVARVHVEGVQPRVWVWRAGVQPGVWVCRAGVQPRVWVCRAGVQPPGEGEHVHKRCTVGACKARRCTTLHNTPLRPPHCRWPWPWMTPSQTHAAQVGGGGGGDATLHLFTALGITVRCHTRHQGAP